ncbi:32165_t:CDS:2, partial [Racocetra persica]
SSIETKDEEDRVKYVDKKFYLNSNELKADDMNIDKDFWSENIEMSNIENEKILKVVENENIDINSIISLCDNGNFNFYQDQKLNGDCGKSTDYFCAEGYKEWNNLNMNFEHAETDSAHNPNNQLQNNNPDLQNNQNNLNSFGQESSTKSIPIFKDTNNNEINHYNEMNDKSRLKENYIDANEPQNYTTSWYAKNSNQKPIKYTDYTNMIEEKPWSEECSNSSTIQVKENTNGFWSVGDSVLTFNTWVPWKDKDEFDYELDKLLKKYKTEATYRFAMDGAIS